MKKMLGSMLGAFSKSPQVKFRTSKANFEVFSHPVRASKKMPDWFKKCPHVQPGEEIMHGTVRRCVPFLDALSHGYIIPLWADLLVQVYHPVDLFDGNGDLIASIFHADDEQKLINEKVVETGQIVKGVSRQKDKVVQFKFPSDVIETYDGREGLSIDYHKEKQIASMFSLNRYEFGKTVGKFHSPWAIETEKGWSCHFKNPPAQYDSNIEILEGVVDTDEYTHNVNFPFIWKGNELGSFLIPAGTPLIQVIPFKRCKTKLTVEVHNPLNQVKQKRIKEVHHFDAYKKLFWHKRKIE